MRYHWLQYHETKLLVTTFKGRSGDMAALHKRITEAPTPAVLGLLAYTISVYTDLGERVEALGAIRHEFVAGIILVGASAFILVNNPLRVQPYRSSCWRSSCSSWSC